MNKSYSERRMERYNKFRKKSSLNLVSLMDIFTILVFFLLVNSSNSQELPNSKQIKLPSSVATKSPQETLVISITSKDILVAGRRVAGIDEVLTLPDDASLIPMLKKELIFQYAKSFSSAKSAKVKGQSVTIMGDENMHYEVLRKVLATCRQANYTRIGFAAIQKVKDDVKG